MVEYSHVVWEDVIWEEGEIVVDGFVKGKKVISQKRETVGEPYQVYFFFLILFVLNLFYSKFALPRLNFKNESHHLAKE